MRKGYRDLSLEERERIAVLKGIGKSIREIARNLKRSPSTISREIRNNSCVVAKKHCYLVHRAEMRARRRKALRGKRKRLKDSEIRDYVREKMKLHWSPEQIAGRIRIDRPGLAISYEAIYQYVYEEAWELFRYLPRKRKRRRLRFQYCKPRHLQIPGRTWVSQRPEVCNQRLEAGHWESDSMVSRQSAASVHVLVERKTRYVRITKMIRMILRRLMALPQALRRTITYDNGPENFAHGEINRRLGMDSYFCSPYHSWEKGTVENTIGLIRRLIPKKTNLERIPTEEIARIQKMLNNRPRKCLNYRTPREVFNTLSVAVNG